MEKNKRGDMFHPFPLFSSKRRIDTRSPFDWIVLLILGIFFLTESYTINYFVPAISYTAGGIFIILSILALFFRKKKK